MVNAPAFIWDLDGTLADSYKVIVPDLREACGELGVSYAEKDILYEVMTRSVADFLSNTEKANSLPPDSLKRRYYELSAHDTSDITPIKNAPELLGLLRGKGISNYIFTHRGISAEAVLVNTGLMGFFDEIVTGADGFPRKPDLAALEYLIKRHGLDRARTFYVGDRAMDIRCADRAGLLSILYLPPGSPTAVTGLETHIVGDLMEIAALV